MASRIPPGPRLLLPVICAAMLLAAATSAEERRPEGIRQSRSLIVRGRVAPAWLQTGLRLGDALVEEFDERFGVRLPPNAGALRLWLYADRGAFEAAVRRADPRADLDGVGGYTSWSAHACFVLLQHNAFETRRLILHELTHLLQYELLPPGRKHALPDWYREGLAEYHGWHRFDDPGVAFGWWQVPTVRPRASAARAWILSEDFDPWPILRGEQSADYTQALALVAGLRQAPKEDLRRKFSAWEERVIRNGVGARAFQQALGSETEGLVAQMRRWAEGWRPQWGARSLGFDLRAGAVEIQSGAEDAWLKRLMPVNPRRLVLRIVRAPERTSPSRVALGFGNEDASAAWMLEVDGAELRLVEFTRNLPEGSIRWSRRVDLPVDALLTIERVPRGVSARVEAYLAPGAPTSTAPGGPLLEEVVPHPVLATASGPPALSAWIRASGPVRLPLREMRFEE